MLIEGKKYMATQNAITYLGDQKLSSGAPKLPDRGMFEPSKLSLYEFIPNGKMRIGFTFFIDDDKIFRVRCLRIFVKDIELQNNISD